MKLKKGITFKCVSCKAKATLTFDEAAKLDSLPACKICYSPMVALSAST